MDYRHGGFANLRAKVIISIITALVIFPLKPIISGAQHLYQQPIIKSDNQDQSLVAGIEYFHMAKVALQGKDEITKDKTETNEAETNNVEIIDKEVIQENEILDIQEPGHLGRLPNSDYREVREVVTTVTAYNPVPEQTDSTPCLTANGTEICKEEKAIVAANWLPFGTKVKIPDYFGDKVFEVHDRMNKRYSNRVDVLMYDVAEAKEFGRRNLRVVVLE